MKIKLTNNWSYCLSKHLTYDWNIRIDEKLCFILSSSLGLRLTPLKPHLFQRLDEFDLSEMYIEPLNSLKAESFANNCCYEVAFTHDYKGLPEIEWIAKELIENKKKFFVNISCQILPNSALKNNENNHIPIFAILSLSESNWTSNIEVSLYEILVELEINNSRTLVVTLGEFYKSWIIEGEIFNANRLAYLTVVTENTKENMISLVKSAILRQYHYLEVKDYNCNIDLLKNLKVKIQSNNCLDEFNKHKNMLAQSFIHQGKINNQDMNRGYFANCFQYMSEEGLYNGDKLVKSLLDSSRAWSQASDLVLKHKSLLTHIELIDMYSTLIEKEALTLETFKKTIYS
jgi:hypothetical protein